MRYLIAILAFITTPLVARSGSAAAQQVGQRIAAVRDGKIRMTFATRPDVCGDGRFIGVDTPKGFLVYSFWNNGHSIGNNGYSTETLEDVQPDCRHGPFLLVVVKVGGTVAEVRGAVGVSWRPGDGATDLGVVPAQEAASWLLDLVSTATGDRFLAEAFLAANAADSVRIADRLLSLARNRKLGVNVRAQALRWVSDAARRESKAAAAEEALRSILQDQTDVLAVRARAVRELDQTPANDAFLRSYYQKIGETRLKERVLRRLGESRTPENSAWIRGVALDPREQRQLRQRAIRVLGQELGRRDEMQQIYGQLDDTELKSQALRVMLDAGDSASIATIRSIALSDKEPLEARDRAVRIFSEVGGDASLSWLQSLAADQGQPLALRDRAIRVLAERGQVEFLEQVYQRLESDRKSTRLNSSH